ncbi:hypothetical protein GOP47_0024681 [Adiantum capillus-veneris]|uniref:Protein DETOXIFICATION n=1 Tax=Adiantum capillus-veneris TaxID=13818 RepID=A0A9D4U272_ADICA|nr:hypothetical protein GOP47_0024681 [Adiantum capillus-veneris]
MISDSETTHYLYTPSLRLSSRSSFLGYLDRNAQSDGKPRNIPSKGNTHEDLRLNKQSASFHGDLGIKKRGCRCSEEELGVSRGLGELKGWVDRFWKLKGEDIWREVKLQCRLAGPMIAVSFSQVAFQLIAVVFVGHLGELALSSSSIATSIANVTGLCIMTGMASGLETLCGQAFGAKQYLLLGQYLQVGIICSNTLAVLISLIYVYMGEILIILGQDRIISIEAGKYARWLIPSLFAHASSQPLIRFLLTQSLVWPLMVCSGIAAAFQVPLCWFLVHNTSFGFTGAALSTSIGCWTYAILLYIYVMLSSSCSKARAPLSLKALHVMGGFVTFAIPSAAMTCLDWWCYEILVLLSGYLPNPQLQTSTLSICLNYANLTYQIASGLAAAASTRVSNELGAGHPQRASNAAIVAVSLTICQGCCTSMFLLVLCKYLGHIFSSDLNVIESVAAMLQLLALSSLLDSTQGVISGIARGCGWQVSGALINLSSYYVVALPTGAYLAFLTPLKARGLWIGLICGSILQVALLGRLMWVAKWDKEAENAMSFLKAACPKPHEAAPLLPS